MMEELLRLLQDGDTRTTEQLAEELHTTVPDIHRQLEFLEYIGVIRRLSAQESGCGSCGGCSGGGCKSLDNSSISCYNGCGGCKSCMPKDAKQNMGELWEVVQR